MEVRKITADLLIIGGGSAGCMAAIRALELRPDLKVVIFEKGSFKYSGSITRGMDALNIVSIPNFTTPELYVEVNTAACDGILDAAPSYKMAQRSFQLLKKLEGWGACFPLDKNGNYLTLQYHKKGAFLTAMEEPNLKVMMARRAKELGVIDINRIMGIELILIDGQVSGAIGLNVRTGELIVCHCKAVILASGGTARFTLPNSGYLFGTFDFPGNTGDGYIMAYRAGARLTGMEHAHKFMHVKDSNSPLMAVAITRGARVQDIFDNIVMDKSNYANEEGPMDRAIQENRGPLRVRLSHLKPEKIDEIEHILFSTERPVQERFFQNRGIDFRKMDIELGYTECQLCGGHGPSGILVNEKAETDVSGLYAAGDTACVPKQHLTGALVFGEIAAEQATEFISSQTGVKRDDSQVKRIEKQRNERFTATYRDIDVQELEYKVRRFIGDYVVSPKNEYKLLRWFECAKRFEDEIENEVVIRNPHELSRLYEIENIIQCATLCARASLERRESRWGNAHHRIDYPKQDNTNWFCHIILSRGNDYRDMQVGTKPIIGLDGKEVIL
jgi:succinate dehydrogenase/fumarate reductase flavoprotein subunit